MVVLFHANETDFHNPIAMYVAVEQAESAFFVIELIWLTLPPGVDNSCKH